VFRNRKSSDGREAVSEDTRLRELAEHDARELRRQLHEALRVIRELRALLEERGTSGQAVGRDSPRR
jgi:hypothetical protein